MNVLTCTYYTHTRTLYNSYYITLNSVIIIIVHCIGYTSNNDWSTSEVPLDQYQEKLQERILSDFNKLELSKKIQISKEDLLVKAREEELL